MPSKGLITKCFPNTSYDEVETDIEMKTKKIYKLYHGYLSIPFAAVGLAFTVIFIMGVIRAIKQHRVSRKCYVLIINRSLGDVLTCISAFGTTSYVLMSDVPNKNIVQVLDTFFIGSFWSGMVSYVSLSLLKLYAVARPFNYRKMVTMKRCIYLVCASWIVCIVILFVTLGANAATKLEVFRNVTGCQLETCLRAMYKVRNAAMTIIYFFTIFCFLITVMFINRARRFVNSFHAKDSTNKPKILRNRFPMWKLALNVATFAGFNIFYIIWALFLLYNPDQCLFMRNFSLMMKLMGMIRLTLMARIIVDPVLSFMTDFQIKRAILVLLGLKNSVSPMDSKRTFQKSTSEENSSECAPNGNHTVEERLSTIKGNSTKRTSIEATDP